jgi:4,5-DOPA dioxygenase extradiol
MQPALFIGHGSPMNALGGNGFSAYLNRLGQGLTKPRAILAISAHWETEGTQVLDLDPPPTIHDFFGFPPELSQIRYPAPGSPWLVEKTAELVKAAPSKSWGLDHGTWSVLRHLIPAANIPVTQLSLNKKLPFTGHYELAQKLRPLREEGVLILTTGNIVHNLRDFSWQQETAPYPWAVEFDASIKRALLERDLQTLLGFKGLDPALVKRAVPSPEHYIPLLYAFGASTKGETPTFPFEEVQNGSIAMRSVRFG